MGLYIWKNFVEIKNAIQMYCYFEYLGWKTVNREWRWVYHIYTRTYIPPVYKMMQPNERAWQTRALFSLMFRKFPSCKS